MGVSPKFPGRAIATELSPPLSSCRCLKAVYSPHPPLHPPCACLYSQQGTALGGGAEFLPFMLPVFLTTITIHLILRTGHYGLHPCSQQPSALDGYPRRLGNRLRDVKCLVQAHTACGWLAVLGCTYQSACFLIPTNPLNFAIRGNRANDCSSSMIFTFYFFLHLFIVVKYTYCKITILTSFKVYDSVTLNTFSVLCNRHHYLFPKLFCHPNRSSVRTSHSPLSQPWLIYYPAFCLCKVACCTSFP